MSSVDLATAKWLLEQKRLRELLQIPEGVQGAQLEKLCKAARVMHHRDKGGSPELASVIGAAVDKLLEWERTRAFAPSEAFHFTFRYAPSGVPHTEETRNFPRQSGEPPVEEANKPRFPKTPVWLTAECPELQLLQIEYQKACDRRRKRISRGDQNTDDLNESIAKILQEAWELTSKPGAHDPACFPPRSRWAGRAEELQQLWKDYRNAASKLSMRRNRSQPTRDVDEQIVKIRRSAWLLLTE
jgi:hypothetical protein